MRPLLLIASLALVGAGCAPAPAPTPTPTPEPAPIPNPIPDPHVNLIQVDAPVANATVSSPLTVTGKARGYWYFEASFPVKLYDANNNLLAVQPAQAQGDWMTENFVPFSVTLTFPTPATPTGTLVLEKDNPSGEPQNDDSISIPVQF